MSAIRTRRWAAIAPLAALAAGAVGASCMADTPASAAERTVTGTSFLALAGTSVVMIGDANGDGVSDYIVGAPENFPGMANAGRAVVYSGADGAVLYTYVGGGHDRLGLCVAAAGDVNNDGRADFIIGSPQDDPGFSQTGRAVVYSGATGLPLWTYVGEATFDRFGASAAALGDINNDGFGDFVIGAPQHAGTAVLAGRVYVYSGKTGALIRMHDGEALGDYFGISVAGPGDVNHDGVPDVLVGAYFNNPTDVLVNSGRAYVYSGADGSIIHTFSGEKPGDELGYSVAAVGDVDNDGWADVLVGARDHDVVEADHRGGAYLYSGQTGALLHAFFGEFPGSWAGSSVAGIGDFDGDGTPDIAVGEPTLNVTGGERPGSVVLYSGRTYARLGAYVGEFNGDEFGTSIGSQLVANPGGHRRLIIGAPMNDSGPLDGGRAYIFHVAPPCRADLTGDGVVDAADLAQLLGAWGTAGPAGDVNGDGTVNSADLGQLLGAWGPCP